MWESDKATRGPADVELARAPFKPFALSHFRTFRRRSAFTLVELLIVIFIIGLLTVIIVTVASKAIHVQRVSNTQSVMKNVSLALDQFAKLDPLRSIYDSRRTLHNGTPQVEFLEPSFGSYPPYQLAGSATNTGRPGVAGGVRGITEPELAAGYNGRPPPASLAERITWDLGLSWNIRVSPDGGAGGGHPYVRLDPEAKADNDNRALYTYLRAFVPDAVARISPNALKPYRTWLGTGFSPPGFERPWDPSHGYKGIANPNGNGTNPASTPPPVGAFDILSINDAWDVPLDYVLYVRLQRYEDDLGNPRWRVSDRRPVLRSHGVSREEYEVFAAMPNDRRQATHLGSDIYSAPLPTPHADVNADGILNRPNDGGTGGWVRLRGEEEEYGYLPQYDQ